MSSIEEKLSEATEAILEDRTEEAAEILQGIESKEIQDAAMHLAIADLCEEVGLIDRLVPELNLAVRAASDEVAVLSQ